MRTDAAGGFTEEVAFLGEGELLFSCLHLPAGEPVAGVVVCSPICADFMANYHREVGLARALASKGVAVARFHYRGTGNSDGDGDAVTFDSLCADARAVIDALVGRTGVRALGLVGTRWGALVAASVSASRPGAPVVLWEPVVDAASYFREALRARRMRDASDGRATAPAPAGVEEELDARGVVDLVGYPVHRALYDSAAGRTLERVRDPDPHPLLIVQLRRGKGIQPAYASLAAALADAGYTVGVTQAALGESWWFHSPDVPAFQPLLDQTVGWLGPRLSPAVPGVAGVPA